MQDKYQQHYKKPLDDIKLKAFIKRSINLPIKSVPSSLQKKPKQKNVVCVKIEGI